MPAWLQITVAGVSIPDGGAPRSFPSERDFLQMKSRVAIVIAQIVLLSSAFLVAAVAITGFLTGQEKLYAPYTNGYGAAVTAMAPLTAVCIILLVGAILLGRGK
jgi:hypothetical protein